MQGLDISKLVPWKQLGFLVAGLVLLGLLIAQQGSGIIGHQLLSVGAVFLAILGIAFFYLFLQTFAWQVCIPDNKGSFWSLFKIKAGGDALNSLLPFALVGGTAVQGQLLRDRHQVEAGAESIVIDRSVQLVAISMFVWVALIVGFLNAVSLPIALRIAVPVIALVGGIFIVWAIRREGPGLFTPLFVTLSAFGIPGCSAPALYGSVREHDRTLLNFYLTKRGAFYQALFLQLLCQGLFVAEIYLIGTALMPAFSPALALSLAATAPLIAAIFWFIPGAFGIMELVFALVLGAAFGSVGAAAGITLVLVRRARALVWIVVGMGLTGNPFKMFLK